MIPQAPRGGCAASKARDIPSKTAKKTRVTGLQRGLRVNRSRPLRMLIFYF